MKTEIPKALELEQKVLTLHNEKEFESIALELFHFQFANNLLYRDYCYALNRHSGNVNTLNQIPFLPISFFKTHKVETTAFDAELFFESSGTTGSRSSIHYVKSSDLYRQSFTKCFEAFFGQVKDYCVIGLLPSYLEKGNSSLVYMVEHLVKKSGQAESGFYLHDFEKLSATLQRLEKEAKRTIVFGVTYALLDFSEKFPQQLRHTIIVETGGMKGRRKELTKEELYQRLKKNLGADIIYSEYGMTELLSQSYAKDGIFQLPPQMKILVRDETDPLSMLSAETKPVTGAVNVIDLANIYSCSFIATDDLARLYANGSFEILGRMDNSDIRGCSQLVV